MRANSKLTRALVAGRKTAAAARPLFALTTVSRITIQAFLDSNLRRRCRTPEDAGRRHAMVRECRFALARRVPR